MLLGIKIRISPIRSRNQSTFFVTGYLPKKQVSAMEKRLTEKYDIVFEAEDAEGENVPVALQNGKFGAAGEGVLAAFGLPGNNRTKAEESSSCREEHVSVPGSVRTLPECVPLHS